MAASFVVRNATQTGKRSATADVYLLDAIAVGAYTVEVALTGISSGVFYSYTAAAVTGMTVDSTPGAAAIGGFAASSAGVNFATTGVLVGTVAMTFADNFVQPSAALSLQIKSGSELTNASFSPITYSPGSAASLAVDVTSPAVTAFSPTDGSTAVFPSSDLVFTVSETSVLGTGNVTIRKDDSTIVATIAAGDTSQVSLVGTTLTINPIANLAPSTHYTATLDAGFFRDSIGNTSPAITTYDFTTADVGYALGATANSVNEGATATFSLQTSGLATGTRVNYSLSGVSASDLVGGSAALNGSVVLDANGRASISVAVAADYISDGAKTLIATVEGQTAQIAVNDSSTTLPTFVPPTAGADNAVIGEDSAPGPFDFKDGNDTVLIVGGDVDVALGAGNDVATITRTQSSMVIAGGTGTDKVVLGDTQSDWTFSTVGVSTVHQLLQSKYPLTSNTDPTTGPFQWDNSALDLVMVATSKIDGTTIYYQAEQTGFQGNAVVNTASLMPAQNIAIDGTIATATAVNVYGRRGTVDTLNLKVANVDEALRNIGSWLDATVTQQATTLGPIANSYTLNLKTQATTPWFTGVSTVANAGYNLVDIENLRIWDSNNRSTTIRIAGINGYDSVQSAVSAAQLGDVIYVSDFKEVLTTSSAGVVTVSSAVMDSNVTVDAGLRVIFEESRTAALATGVVNTVTISENEAKIADSSVNRFFGGTRALEILGSSAVNVNGSAQDDLIIGNKGANTILGGAGNDMIFGGNGADVILGQQGNDILIGGSAYSVKGASVLASSSTVNSSTDTINLGAGHMFNTGDAVQYVVGTGGAAITGLTTATTYYAIKVDDSTIKLATTVLNADFGVAIDITAPTAAQTVKHFFVPNTAAQGSDFLSGGSGNDTLIALNSIGTSTTAFDTVSMLGGSGNDKMVAFGNTGKVNAFGGTGNDLYQTWDDFNNIKVSGGTDAPSYTNSQKAMKVFDFAALNDDIVSTFASSTPESQLNTNGLTLNQLVAPPLPIVNGTGDNGNYSQASNQTVQGMDLGWSGSSTVSIAELVNLHSAHAV